MSIRIIQGDVRDELPKLPADYFDCIVTSPPYYGLRDYGTATWEGGDPACDHSSGIIGMSDKNTLGPSGHLPQSNAANIGRAKQFSNICGKCSASRIDAQIGLETTLDAYLETMVAVCRELRRVLKPSGVCFINIGDSYNGGGIGGGGGGNLTKPNANRNNQGWSRSTLKVSSLKPKDLMLVPERLGILLQQDGWWVRSRIVWAKPNPMPESCTDRPTSAHETIWMLTKSAQYFWDGEAVKEALIGRDGAHPPGNKTKADNYGIKRRDDFQSDKIWGADGLRNIRNVWTIPSHAFPGAHFATFPPVLVERCIKAGSSEKGCCPMCGKPWVRITDVSRRDTRPNYSSKYGGNGGADSRMSSPSNVAFGLARRTEATVTTTGWQPSCKCPDAAPIPARILDPFAGSGTVGLVADRLGRDATLIDLNTSYIDMAVNRIRDDCPMFAEVAAE